MSVKIIVDSTTDLNEAIKDQFAIVPLTICFGEEEYVDGVTITHHQFYEKLVESDVLPTTSQASPSAFTRVFDEVLGTTTVRSFSRSHQSYPDLPECPDCRCRLSECPCR